MTDSEKPYILRAVESVITQTISCKIRIYVSLDNTWIYDIIPSDKDIIIRRIELNPPGIIRNIGASESDTEWIAFLDGDDVWTKNKIKKQLRIAVKYRYDAIATDHLMIDEHDSVIACGLGGKNIPMTSSWLVKRKLVTSNPFSAKMTGEDSEWWTQAKKIARLNRLASFQTKYRLKSISLSTETSSKKRKMLLLKYSNIFGLKPIIIVSTWFANKIYRWM
ncbi:MAG: glycosyltransferase [Candidatus Thiodiazotropha sp.]